MSDHVAIYFYNASNQRPPRAKPATSRAARVLVRSLPALIAQYS